MLSTPKLSIFVVGFSMAFAASPKVDLEDWLTDEPSKPLVDSTTPVSRAIGDVSAVKEEAQMDKKLAAREEATIDQEMEFSKKNTIQDSEDIEAGVGIKTKGEEWESNVQEEATIDDDFEASMKREEAFHEQENQIREREEQKKRVQEEQQKREEEEQQKRIEEMKQAEMKKEEMKQPDSAPPKANVLKRKSPKKAQRKCRPIRTNSVDYVMSHLEDGEDAEVIQKLRVTSWPDCVQICQSNPICKQVAYAKDEGFCVAISSSSFHEAKIAQKDSGKYMVATCIDSDQANGRRLNEF